MATRYNLEITFGGEESEAPEDWHVGAINKIASMIDEGYSCGEVPHWEENKLFRVFWTLDAEDE